MYNHSEYQMILPEDFFLPFGGKLNRHNRWVKLAYLIPWWKAEDEYKEQLKDLTQGAHAYSVRMALGALIIKERLGTSDEETVEQITENPYLQYLLGLPEFQEKPPFHSSTLTHFRKRISSEMIQKVNEWIVQEASKSSDDDDNNEPPNNDNPLDEASKKRSSADQKTGEEPRYHQGKLLIDATCAPVEIAYPTDLKLLNESREKLEKMIDTLHATLPSKQKKPRTYRKTARKAYLSLAKQKKPGKQKLRKGIKKQLNYVKRDLGHIHNLVEQTGLTPLNKRQYRDLLVIQELHRQQRQMFQSKSHRIEDRIVSISQPHVRPIVRGKVRTNVEFGAKLSLVMKDGWAFLDNLQWDAYHEGTDLKRAILTYKARFGYYPEAVLADKIYLTRENRRFCKDLGIRLSGPRLGRPPKQENKEQKRMAYQDACERNAIEGKFGEGKRIYGLGLIRARLKETSETTIALQILNLNISKALRDLYSFLLIVFAMQHGNKVGNLDY